MNNAIYWRKGNQRYYKIYVTKDLFNHYILTCVWGGVNSRLGNYKNYTFFNLNDANQFIDDISKRRLQRGYKKIAIQ